MNISPSRGINTLTLSSYLNLPERTSTALEKAESSFHGSFIKDAGRACKLAIKGALKSGELRRCDIGHPKHLLHTPDKGTDEAHQDGCPPPFKSESMGENICLPAQPSLLWGNHLSLHLLVILFVVCGMQNNSLPKISMSLSLGPINM